MSGPPIAKTTARRCVSVSVVASFFSSVSCASLSGLSDDGRDASVPSGDAATRDVVDSAPGTDSSDASVDAPIPPGSIRCASTSVTCDVSASECCIVATGKVTPPRTLESSSAHCGPIGGPNCGRFYLTTGDTYQMAIVQTCSSHLDCEGGVCCTELAGGDMYVEAITCKTQSQCNAIDGGHALCALDSDCSGRTCTTETDPVLSQIYSRSCR